MKLMALRRREEEDGGETGEDARRETETQSSSNRSKEMAQGKRRTGITEAKEEEDQRMDERRWTTEIPATFQEGCGCIRTRAAREMKEMALRRREDEDGGETGKDARRETETQTKEKTQSSRNQSKEMARGRRRTGITEVKDEDLEENQRTDEKRWTLEIPATFQEGRGCIRYSPNFLIKALIRDKGEGEERVRED
ncbi:hypothetical protein NDU88_009169 [Pleurodeles waltl]|uniref:Uncharacterized protein n=1 Tax=Pleurodeles waltl TaxID=8319 RepID=A0AAV7PU72_PLEWA|nr:hypothetical protein NDU88_009169 [Pleurodeles waltl]